MQFKDVLVAPQLKAQIINQVKLHRVSHAQLFHAQPGSHAFALAIAMAQYMCCEHPTDNDSCGQCPSCIQFEKLTHPDLHLYFPNCITKNVKKEPDCQQFMQEFREFVFQHDYHIDIQDWLTELEGENKQANINIRDCSNIISHNNVRSYSGGFKFYILWNIDRLYHAAAPKLLKTLEEPEGQSLFILISEKPEQILKTILSRTQLVTIPKLTDEQLATALRKRFPDMEEQTAHDIAMLADGDYNRAFQIHADDSDYQASLAAFDILMGSALSFSRQQSAEVVNYPRVHEEMGEIVAQGREAQKAFLTFTIRMLRNMLMTTTNHPEMVKATHAEQTILEKYKGAIGLKQATLLTEECNKALFHIGRNANSGIVFTDLFFKMAGALR